VRRRSIQPSGAIRILEAMTKEFPDRILLQRELAIALNQLGNIRRVGQQFPQALDAHRRALALVQSIAATEPGKILYQRDLWLSYNKIADVEAITGQLDDALATYRAGLNIIKELLVQKPDDPGFLGDLAFNHGRIAIVLWRQNATRRGTCRPPGSLGDSSKARSRNTKPHRPSTRCVCEPQAGRRNVDNTRAAPGGAAIFPRRCCHHGEACAFRPRQCPLAERSCRRLSILWPQSSTWPDNRDEALQMRKNAVAARERMVAIAPGNAQWQSDLARSYVEMADRLVVDQKPQEAVEFFEKGRAIRARLAAEDPDSRATQVDLAYVLERMAILQSSLADLPVRNRQLPAALLRSADGSRTPPPGNAILQRQLAYSRSFLMLGLYQAGEKAEADQELRSVFAIVEKYAGANPDTSSCKWI